VLQIRGHAPEYVEGLYARAAAEHSLDPRALVAYANYLQFTCLGERNVQLEEEENTRVAVQAGQLYETALMLDPSHYEALHGYGLYQRNELYDNQGALICYNLALELRPNDPILLCNMAAALSSTQPQGDSALPDNSPRPDCHVLNTTTAGRRALLHCGAKHCRSDLVRVG
jgi:tetratricopeptide (TPR) repeat protein